MPSGDEVLCAVRDVESGAQIVRVGAALAFTLSLRLVIVHARQRVTPPATKDTAEIARGLRTLADESGAELRVHDGAPLAVLQGLGRALGSAWIVVGDARPSSAGAPLGETARRLLDTSGCPLLVVSGRGDAESRGPVACLVDGDASTRARELASRVAQALETSVVAGHPVSADNPATETRASATLAMRAAALLHTASAVLVIRRSALDRRNRAAGSVA